MIEKLNIVFKPFIFTLIGLIVGYTLVHWLVFIKLDLFSIKDIITNFAIPAVLTALAILFFLRPNFKALNLDTKRGNWRDFYSFIAWIALTIPLIIAQEYVVTATGKLTALNSINEIGNSAPTKYYSLKKHYINKKAIATHSEFDVSGRNSDSFNMHIYIAMPIFENENDTLTKAPLAWLGVAYHKSISNRLEGPEKELKFKAFAEASQVDFNHKDVSEFVYLDRIGSSDAKEGYVEAIRKEPNYKANETILVGINEPFSARNGKKLQWVFISSLIGSMVWLLMSLIPKTDQKQLNRIKAGKPDKVAQKEVKEFFDFLIPKEGYFITPILIYINVAVFLLMAVMGLGFISFKGDDLLNWGANFKPLTTHGQWWRLLTSTFLHGGLMHLLANMYGLLFVGIFLEPLLGKVRYALIYLATGILASVASICWYDATVSVGASGAIFGLYGLFLAMLLTKVYAPNVAKPFLISTSVFICFNLLMGLTGGIDNAAHIGGLLSGFLIGIILSPTLKRKVEAQKPSLV
ncbi:rhomboid family intramembrane serine protease [Pedobacter sp.]|uniref:rhomboid family intramembrane serine protease n=1 Tax=Pedobacter sp. TaxID=1411316 RepID=UPI0031CE583C